MTIQSLINQAINTGTVAAGLYAHSPSGQSKIKTKQLEKEYESVEKAYNELSLEGLASPGGEALEKRLMNIRKEQLVLNPKLANVTGNSEIGTTYLEEAYGFKPNPEVAKQKARMEERALQLERQRKGRDALNQLRNAYGGL